MAPLLGRAAGLNGRVAPLLVRDADLNVREAPLLVRDPAPENADVLHLATIVSQRVQSLVDRRETSFFRENKMTRRARRLFWKIFCVMEASMNRFAMLLICFTHRSKL